MGAKLKSEDILGKVFSSKNYGDYVVVGFRNWWDIDIKFLTTGYIKKTNKGEINRGCIKDPYCPNIYGVGYCGEGSYPLSYNRCGFKINTPAYEVWLCRLKSCYGNHKDMHQYVGVEICKEWLNFQNFAEWFYKQVKIYGRGGHVDKDLLLLGNRQYSPDTCVYVPQAVNSLFTGVSGNISGSHWCNTQEKWVAQIQRGELTAQGKKKQSYLGKFNDKESADAAYYSAKLAHVKSVVLKYQDQIPPVLFYKMYHGTENYLNYYMFEKENNNAPQE